LGPVLSGRRPKKKETPLAPKNDEHSKRDQSQKPARKKKKEKSAPRTQEKEKRRLKPEQRKKVAAIEKKIGEKKERAPEKLDRPVSWGRSNTPLIGKEETFKRRNRSRNRGDADPEKISNCGGRGAMGERDPQNQ